MTRRFARALLVVPLIAAGLSASGARADGVVVLPGSYHADPGVAVDPNGVVYVGADAGCCTELWRVDAEGATKLSPGGIFGALPGGATGDLATDTAGYLHLAQVASTITVRRSIDEGGTWDRGTALAGAGAVAVRLAASGFNSVVEGATLTLGIETRAGAIVVARSIDGGLSFPQQTLVDTGANLGALVADESGDNVAVAYARDGAIVVAASTDGGLSFRSSVAIAAPADGAIAPTSLARAGGGYVLAWRDDAREYHISRSADGVAWSDAISWSRTTTSLQLASKLNGAVAATWIDCVRERVCSARAMLSTDGGERFGDVTTLGDLGDFDADGTADRVAVASDPTAGFVAAFDTDRGIAVARF